MIELFLFMQNIITIENQHANEINFVMCRLRFYQPQICTLKSFLQGIRLLYLTILTKITAIITYISHFYSWSQ